MTIIATYLLAVALTLLLIGSCAAGPVSFANFANTAVLLVVIWVTELIYVVHFAERIEDSLAKASKKRKSLRKLTHRRASVVERREWETSTRLFPDSDMRERLFADRGDALAWASEVIDEEIYKKTQVCRYCSTQLAKPAAEISVRHVTVFRTPPPDARDLKVVEKKGWEAWIHLRSVTCSECKHSHGSQSWELLRSEYGRDRYRY